MKLYSTTDISELTGKAESTVRMLAAKHTIGSKVSGTWVFTEADVEAFKNLPGRGRPKREKADLEDTDAVVSSARTIPR